jgi:hypothetical protein
MERENIIKKEPITPNPPQVQNFQEWLQHHPYEHQHSLEDFRDNLAGKHWLARGAPKEGETGKSIDKSEAERLLYEAYIKNDADALSEILRLWNL